MSHGSLNWKDGHLVTHPLGGLAIGEGSQQLLDDLELAPEQSVLGHVHLEKVQVGDGSITNVIIMNAPSQIIGTYRSHLLNRQCNINY